MFRRCETLSKRHRNARAQNIKQPALGHDPATSASTGAPCHSRRTPSTPASPPATHSREPSATSPRRSSSGTSPAPPQARPFPRARSALVHGRNGLRRVAIHPRRHTQPRPPWAEPRENLRSAVCVGAPEAAGPGRGRGRAACSSRRPRPGGSWSRRCGWPGPPASASFRPAATAARASPPATFAKDLLLATRTAASNPPKDATRPIHHLSKYKVSPRAPAIRSSREDPQSRRPPPPPPPPQARTCSSRPATPRPRP